MKKSLLVAVALVATSVVAQPRSEGSPASVGRIPVVGNITAPALVGAGLTIGVAASVIANANGDAKPEPVKTLKCEGTDPLVNNVCVRTTQVTTVTGTGTGTGTGTATTTIVVPVTSTYAPTLG